MEPKSPSSSSKRIVRRIRRIASGTESWDTPLRQRTRAVDQGRGQRGGFGSELRSDAASLARRARPVKLLVAKSLAPGGAPCEGVAVAAVLPACRVAVRVSSQHEKPRRSRSRRIPAECTPQ